ncbi:transposable element Tcb1 transposase [Trichonephila clavipes]|nr:transposable element Tcb1 transposase [Trichonephila clavipes]
MPRRKIQAHYEQLSEFERGRIIRLKEAVGKNYHSGPKDIPRGLLIEVPIKLLHRLSDCDGSLAQLSTNCPLGIPCGQNGNSLQPTQEENVLIQIRNQIYWKADPYLFLIEHLWHMMGRSLHLPWNVDDLVRELEQTWQEIPQATIRMLYPSMPRRVAACTQARGGQHLIELVAL